MIHFPSLKPQISFIHKISQFCSPIPNWLFVYFIRPIQVSISQFILYPLLPSYNIAWLSSAHSAHGVHPAVGTIVGPSKWSTNRGPPAILYIAWLSGAHRAHGVHLAVGPIVGPSKWSTNRAQLPSPNYTWSMGLTPIRTDCEAVKLAGARTKMTGWSNGPQTF